MGQISFSQAFTVSVVEHWLLVMKQMGFRHGASGFWSWSNGVSVTRQMGLVKQIDFCQEANGF